MGKRGTTKPCPGCGETVWRPTQTEVCSDCKQAIKYYAEFQEVASARRDLYMTADQLHLDGGLGKLHKPLYAADVRRETYHRVFDSLHTIITVGFPGNQLPRFGEKVGEPLFEPDRHSYGTQLNLVVQMPAPVAEAFRILGTAIGESVEQAYTNGQVRGESLLRGLADGTMSEASFNAASIEKKLAAERAASEDGSEDGS